LLQVFAYEEDRFVDERLVLRLVGALSDEERRLRLVEDRREDLASDLREGRLAGALSEDRAERFVEDRREGLRAERFVDERLVERDLLDFLEDRLRLGSSQEFAMASS
jgi:hypothetical protein